MLNLSIVTSNPYDAKGIPAQGYQEEQTCYLDGINGINLSPWSICVTLTYHGHVVFSNKCVTLPCDVECAAD